MGFSFLVKQVLICPSCKTLKEKNKQNTVNAFALKKERNREQTKVKNKQDSMAE